MPGTTLFLPGASDVIPGVDSSEILPGLLWQSAKPPTGTLLRDCGVKAVAFCAVEYQPSAHLFPGVQVIHSPSYDNIKDPPTRETLAQAVATANKLVAVMKQGGLALSTCHMGINRSGLVSALAVHKFLGVSGMDAIMHVRLGRRSALRNGQFLRVLEKIPAPT